MGIAQAKGPSVTDASIDTYVTYLRDVRRMSPRWSLGSSPGPTDITTRFFAHFRRAIGTRSRSSALSPVVARRTLPRAFAESTRCGELPLEAGRVASAAKTRSVSTKRAAPAPRQPPPLPTGAV